MHAKFNATFQPVCTGLSFVSCEWATMGGHLQRQILLPVIPVKEIIFHFRPRERERTVLGGWGGMISISEKLFDKFGERQNFADADRGLHRDELVEVVRRLGRRDRRVRRRWLHPRPVGLLHVTSIRREGREKDGGWHDPEEAMVLGVEDGVGTKRLRDVLVKEGGEREVWILQRGPMPENIFLP